MLLAIDVRERSAQGIELRLIAGERDCVTLDRSGCSGGSPIRQVAGHSLDQPIREDLSSLRTRFRKHDGKAVLRRGTPMRRAVNGPEGVLQHLTEVSKEQS